MSKLKKPVEIETTFNTYRLIEQLGQGGAGCVYGGLDAAGEPVAVKVLTAPGGDKRRRFKNEIAFLQRNSHPNIVTVTDHGVATSDPIKGPFYVMPRFSCSLRDVIKQTPSPNEAMKLFSQILDGVEAAHLQQVTHRDLKPENVLIDSNKSRAAVADFGVARFTEEQLHTLVQTHPTARLANFQYAAPEQRAGGHTVGTPADIYALGLILNELFTGSVPHGTAYRTIASVAADFTFLDPIVVEMLQQNPASRPGSIVSVKQLIQRHRAEAVSLQKLSEFKNVVIPAGEVDDPLAHQPPQLIGANFDRGTLRLTLDRPVNSNWVHALHNMGHYSSVPGADPQAFRFNGTEVMVGTQANRAQDVIDHFKVWLPQASRVLKHSLEREAQQKEVDQRKRLDRELEAERQHLEINRSLKV
ncbi:serine/threonine protein kinase [Rhodoligotrophos appendicifer]|uniref:serine/threonine-protein kinase n=1 Tax=Rhodoligotrophos appendicifer TaxID=987056 RepID=UPI00117DEA55|nr:serine/threonine-protein kinase [Rhodoligotrophos appendicifer]